MPHTFSARSGGKRRMTRRPLAVESLEARDVPAAYTWVPTGPGAFDWNDAANWTGGPAGTFPNAAGDVAVLTGSLTGNQLINLNGGITVGELDVGSTGPGGYTIAANGTAGTLTFADGDGTANLTATGSAGSAVLAPIILNTNTTLVGTGAAPLALGSTVGGAGTTLTTSGGVLALDRFAVLSTVTLAGTGTISAAPVLYAPSFYDGGLYAFNAETGATLATLIAPNAASSLALPAGQTVGPDGNLYVSAQGLTGPDNSIVRYNLRTFTAETFISSAVLQNLVDPANTGNAVFAPAGLRFGPDGNLYVAASGGSSPAAAGTPDAVYRFITLTGPNGDRVDGAGTQVVGGIFNPLGLAFGTAAGDTNNLYVTSGLGTPGNVVKITGATGASPTPTAIVTSANNAGLQSAAGLTIGPDGKLYVADLAGGTGTSQVLSYNTDGTGGAVFIATDNGPSGTSPGDLGRQFSTDLAFDSQGRLRLVNLGPSGPTTNSNDYAGSIDRYSSAGVFDKALVTAAQFPDTGTVPPTASDSEASGVIPAAVSQSAAITVVAARVSPGTNGPGVLTVPDFDLASGSFFVDIAGAAPGTGYDRLASTGTVNLGGTQLNVAAPFATPAGSKLVIVSAAAVTGTFNGLPDGATVTANGQEFTINYTATAVTLTRAADVAPTITAPDAATFYTTVPVNFVVTATGSPAPTFTIASGSLPAGLSLNTTTGAITGTPTAAGPATVGITAANAAGTDTDTFTFTVQAGVAPAVTSIPNPTFMLGTPVNFTVTATGTPTPTLSVTGTLPPGLAFDPATGVLSGTPTQDGVYPLTITASNGVGSPARQDFSPSVDSLPGFASPAAATFTVGVGDALYLRTTGFPRPSFGIAGRLPAGVTFQGLRGILSGTPTEAGTFPITFTVSNSSGRAAQNFTLTVNPAPAAPAVTNANSAAFGVGQAGTFTVTATGTPPPTLFVSGTLPTGVSFDATTNQLTGTPAAGTAGTYPITFTAVNSVATTTQSFTLTVQAGATGTAPAFTSGTSAAFAAGTAGSFQVSATGTPTPTLSVTGVLPVGLTFDPATGLLSGTPTSGAAGVYPLTLTATNGVSTAGQTLTVTVAGPPSLPVTLPGRLVASGPAAGSVAAFDPATGGQYAAAATAPPSPFAGYGVPVRTAVADVDGDGTPDIVYVTGPGVSVQFAVASGKDGSVLVGPTIPFEDSFTGGGFVAAADLDGDGLAEIVITPDQGGGPRVTIFSRPTGGGLSVRANFFGIEDPSFRGGARAAIGDVNADGTPDLVVAAGFLGGPRVSVLNGATLFGTPGNLVNDFFAFPGADAVNLRNGAYVAVGDVDGDGYADLIFGGGPDGGPRVYALSGKLVSTRTPDVYDANPIANFFVAGDTTARGGVRVGTVDADGDGRADIVTGSGSGLPGSVRVYLGKNVTGTTEPTTFQTLAVFGGSAQADGVYVG